MAIVTLKTKNQVTIPTELTRQLNLSVGDLLEVTADRGRLILTPKVLVDRKPARKQKK